ncbi:Homeobox-leucine zipper HAT22-like protein [Gossypium australe]|uniref:Homeobox-leucine zipper HAT22-like protein n=1 Tax=Gossypium australe TaxID=47621 RepID=A0A5B6WHP0_9ROSI|nr:Homeobox-leucine zipper HAT22-like protein [Gossypium australe]
MPEKSTAKVVLVVSFEPFLTLGLSGECYRVTVIKKVDVNNKLVGGYLHPRHEDSPPAPATGDLSHRLKRKTIDKNSCRVRDEDEDHIDSREKLRLTKQQSALLEESFKQHSTLNLTKLKQTEVDCEFLERFCEKLTNENKSLQKELQELRGLKTMVQPFCMNMLATTLTTCLSCERIGGIVGDGNSNNQFLMPSKPHFYKPITNPFVAC